MVVLSGPDKMQERFPMEINFPHEGFPRSGEAVTEGD